MATDAKLSINYATKFLITLAAFVIVAGGMRIAAPIVVPFLLAMFIAIIASPPLFFLQRRGVPKGLAMLLVIIVIAMAAFLITALMGKSLSDFSAAVPSYSERLSQEMERIQLQLGRWGIEIPEEARLDIFDPSAIMRLAGTIFSSLRNMLTNTFLIFMTVVFILLETSSIPVKLQQIAKNPQSAMAQLQTFTHNINRYVTIKTTLSLATGIIVAIWLQIIGVDYALLWGLLAFLLNYIPNIGSIIAAIPAVLVAFVQGGLQLTMLTAAGYLVVNIVIGNLLEPRIMGRGLGLSTLVVFISLIFWGWILGPVGMLLSVPLTMMIKVVLESNAETAWIGVLLGSETDARVLSNTREEGDNAG
jgi:predicted PurR-regulated permease PerM